MSVRNYTAGRKRAVVLFMTVLFAFMFLADMYLIRHQRNFLRSHARAQAEEQLELMQTYFLVQLIEYNYVWVDNFIQEWGKSHPEVLRIGITSPDGEELMSFSRSGDTLDTLVYEEPIVFLDEHLVTLYLEVSYTRMDDFVGSLNKRLIIVSIVMTFITGICLWWTLTREALSPLEQEIQLRKEAEKELEAIRDGLEDIVHERTFELEETNVQLIKEVRERKSAEGQYASLKRQYELILDSAGEGICGIDIEGNVAFINKAALELLGYEREEVIGHPLHEVSHHVRFDGSPYEKGECPVCKHFSAGTLIRDGESYFRTRDGNVFPVNYVSAPIREEGVVVGAVVVFEDITERKRFEHELVELTDTLEMRVKKRTASLDAANEDLKSTLDQLQQTQEQLINSEKMAALGDLVAGVAHEINTPVGVGVTAASHLEKEAQSLAKLYKEGGMKRSDLESFIADSQDSSQLILSNLNRAAELIRSFKQVATDQSGETRRSFKMKEYVEEVCLSLRPILKKTPHRVEVECDEGLSLNSYPGAFSQIVTNFITNSVMHAFTGNTAGCLHFAIHEEKGIIHFTYADDGKGMGQEEVAHIFDPFYTTSREQGGSGLGLHIVYNIVTQRLMGSIKCLSEPGKGTSFMLKFPMVLDGGDTNATTGSG